MAISASMVKAMGSLPERPIILTLICYLTIGKIKKITDMPEYF